MIEPYRSLLDLTRKQRDLIDSGDWTSAVALGDDWQRVVAGLPDQPPGEAKELLEEAASIARSNTATIEALTVEVSRELEHVARGRRALSMYAGALAASVDTHG